MSLRRTILLTSAAVMVWFITSCANQATTAADGKAGNPHPPGTYEHFKAEPSYPKAHSVWKNDELLARTDAIEALSKATRSHMSSSRR